MNQSDIEALDRILSVVRTETVRTLSDLPAIIAPGDLEGDAMRAATLTLVLLVRRARERDQQGRLRDAIKKNQV